MAKKNRPDQLQYGGYVQMPVGEEDVDQIDKMITAVKGNPTATIASIVADGWRLTISVDDNAWKVVISNMNDMFGDGKTYFVSAEGNTLLEAALCMQWKLTRWKDLGYPLPAEPARGRFR